MIVKCDGIQIGKFKIPAFELHKGELLGIYLYNGLHSHHLRMELVSVLNSQKTIRGLTVFEKLEFVKHFKESKFKRHFSPTTIEAYIKNNGQHHSLTFNKIHQADSYIKRNTKIQSLAGTPRKLVSLFTTLSNTNKIVLDLAGVDPSGGDKVLDLVLESVNQGGNAILLDNYEDSEAKCTKFIRIEMNE